jgi:hypothetical protein
VTASRTPPLETVRALQAALAEAGVPSVVGGSGLLAALELVDEARDWAVAYRAMGRDARADLLEGAGPGGLSAGEHPPRGSAPPSS